MHEMRPRDADEDVIDEAIIAILPRESCDGDTLRLRLEERFRRRIGQHELSALILALEESGIIHAHTPWGMLSPIMMRCLMPQYIHCGLSLEGLALRAKLSGGRGIE